MSVARLRGRDNSMADGATRGRTLHVVDSAGVFGAIVAALCCAGTPIILAALAAVGLSFLRKDAILWPLMLGSLLVALWGFWRGFQAHRRAGPIVLGLIGAVSLASGVILVHGFPAMQMIYGGAVALMLASAWNVWARRA
jgi:mercuric ion transport protein